MPFEFIILKQQNRQLEEKPMTTNNKSLNSLFLIIFASQNLISMPPKARSSINAISIGGSQGLVRMPVDLNTIGTRSVTTLPDRDDRPAYLTSIPQTPEGLLFLIEEKIDSIKSEKSEMILRRNQASMLRSGNRTSILEVIDNDILLCNTTIAQLNEVKNNFQDLEADTLIVHAIINDFSSNHKDNMDTFNALNGAANFRANRHGPDARFELKSGLKQKAAMNKERERLQQPQAPKTPEELASEIAEWEKATKELEALLAEEAQKTTKPSRAPKSKKGK